jgi:HAD superfamily hydrolase (TIGR01509 family)
MIKAVIFDCFGVIVGQGFDHTYKTAGGDPKEDRQFIDDMLGQDHLGLISGKEFNKDMAEHLGLSEEEWQATIQKAELADHDLLNYVIELRKKYKTAILSNSNKGVLVQKIGKEWMGTCFDEIVSSAEVGLTKPDPEIYKLTAERLGVKANECVFIDNRQLFVDAAKAIGMEGLLYTDLPRLKQELSTVLSR